MMAKTQPMWAVPTSATSTDTHSKASVNCSARTLNATTSWLASSQVASVTSDAAVREQRDHARSQPAWFASREYLAAVTTALIDRL